MIVLFEHMEKGECPSWLASASVCVEKHDSTFDGLGSAYRSVGLPVGYGWVVVLTLPILLIPDIWVVFANRFDCKHQSEIPFVSMQRREKPTGLENYLEDVGIDRLHI